MSPLTITILLLIAAGLGVFTLVRKLAGPATVSECDPEWIAKFSIARYRPMLRLLDEADYEFLASQPGYSKEFIENLRTERRAIFRAYLRSLVRDFHRLHLAARAVLVHATEDRSDLAMTLVRQRVTFTLAIMTVEYRLVLHALGLGTVDVRGLIAAVDGMRANVRNLAAVQSAA